MLPSAADQERQEDRRFRAKAFACGAPTEFPRFTLPAWLVSPGKSLHQSVSLSEAGKDSLSRCMFLADALKRGVTMTGPSSLSGSSFADCCVCRPLLVNALQGRLPELH